ncbi:MAG TPA: hypothetical protein VK364_13625, partial [Hymenobacter sp.]|nr:hypothetical protein [Hymenobacter sp.]
MPLPSRHIARARRLAWLVLLLTWLAPPLMAQTVHWQQTYGLTYTDSYGTRAGNDFKAAVATPDGGFLLVGTTPQNVPGSTTASASHGLLIKVDASGQVLWQKTSATIAPTAATASPDGGFLLVGQTSQTVPGTTTAGNYGLVVKVDASGNELWRNTCGLTYSISTSTFANNSLNAAVATPDGGFLLAGNAYQYLPGSRFIDIYGLVVKVDANGNVLWQKTCGLTHTSGSATTAANELYAAVATPDGGFLLAGNGYRNLPGSAGVGWYGLVVKVDADGDVLWQKSCGLTYTSGTSSTASNALNAAVATLDGGFLLVGQTTQTVPGTTTSGTYGLVVKMDAAGNVLSQQTSGLTYSSGTTTSASNNLRAAVATPDGGFLLAGQTTQNVPGSTSLGTYGLLVKVDASGQALWPAPRTVPPAAGLTDYSVKAAVAIPGGGVLLAGKAYQSPGTPAGDYGWAALVDSVATGLLLQQADGTAQAADKPFRLLWQPVLTVGGLDSLARPQLRGTVTTFQGGRVLLP